MVIFENFPIYNRLVTGESRLKPETLEKRWMSQLWSEMMELANSKAVANKRVVDGGYVDVWFL